MDNRTTDQVFNNPYLLSEILFHSFTDIVGDVNLRLVNKTFNNAHLMATKRKFRKMEIKSREEETPGGKRPFVSYFFINDMKLKLSKMWPFLEFLNNVVHLKVEELRLKDFRLSGNAAIYFHEKIHSNLVAKNRKNIKIFIGFERICRGCEKCLELAKTVREYGPIEFSSLQKLEKPENPRKLIITDRLMEQIANHCVSISSSREECLKEVQKWINPLLSQSELVLWIRENRKSLFELFDSDHPLEVIEMFLKIWNVKSIKIHFIFDYVMSYNDSKWAERQYFTKFRFNVEKIATTNSSLRLDHVTMDLSESYYCSKDWETDNVDGAVHRRGYENLLSNIRKLCSSNQIFIKNFYIFGNSIEKVQSLLNKSMAIVRKVKQRSLTVNIEVLTQIKTISELSLKLPEDVSIVVPRVHSDMYDTLDHTRHFHESQPMLRFIGRQLEVEDNESHIDYKLDLYLNKSVVNHGRPEETIDETAIEWAHFLGL